MTPRAAWFFPIPNERELPERLQSLFAKARETIGFVPNVFRAYSYRPTTSPRTGGTPAWTNDAPPSAPTPRS